MGSESEDVVNHRYVKWATTVIAQAKMARLKRELAIPVSTSQHLPETRWNSITLRIRLMVIWNGITHISTLATSE